MTGPSSQQTDGEALHLSGPNGNDGDGAKPGRRRRRDLIGEMLLNPISTETLAGRVQMVLREHPGVPITEWARIFSCKHQMVQQWIQERVKSMRLDYAMSCEQNLGYSHEWLMRGTGPKFAANKNPGRELPKDDDRVSQQLLATYVTNVERAIVKQYREATEEGRVRVSSLLEVIPRDDESNRGLPQTLEVSILYANHAEQLLLHAYREATPTAKQAIQTVIETAPKQTPESLLQLVAMKAQ